MARSGLELSGLIRLVLDTEAEERHGKVGDSSSPENFDSTLEGNG
jgi:hypothetical protein